MKTIDSLRQYIPVLTFCLVLIASSVEAGAQNRRDNFKKDREHNEYHKSDHHKKVAEKGRKENKYYSRKSDYQPEGRVYYPKYSVRNMHQYPNYFDHPKHGRVYHRFDHNPIVLKHRHGDYYYAGNNFYRYHEGIGYCVVEPPRNMYFSHLPVECNRVRINGHVFFRTGDLFFQLSPAGYMIVPSPTEVRFTVRF